MKQGLDRNHRKESIIRLVFISILIFILGSVIVLTLVPPVSRDALTHHLAVPKLWIQNNGFCELPWIVYSYYPMNLDLLYLIPLSFGNDTIPKLIHFCFSILTAHLIFSYLKKKTGILYGLMGAILFLSLPVIIKLSITAYVDLGLIYFSFASIILLLKWKDSGYPMRTLVMAGVCCGLALGTKYNGMISFLLIACLVPVIRLRSQRSKSEKNQDKLLLQLRALGNGAVFVFAALAVFSPWMIKNYRLTENPVYPLYDAVFNDHQQLLDEPNPLIEPISKTNSKNRLNHFVLRKLIYGETPLQTALIPIRIFFQGKDNDPKHFDGKLNPFLLLLPLLLFPGRKKIPCDRIEDIIVFTVFTASYILFVFLQIDMRIRWVGPAIPGMVILSILGLENIVSYAKSKLSRGHVSLIASSSLATFFLMLTINGHYLKTQFDVVMPFSYLSGKIEKAQYIERYRKEYPVIQYANKTLPDNAILLGIFMGNRSYYIDNKIIFNNNLLYDLAKQARSHGWIATNLASKGVTHLMIQNELFQRQIAERLDAMQTRKLIAFLDQSTVMLYSKNGYSLYQCKNN